MSTETGFRPPRHVGRGVEEWRRQFPALAQEINGHRLAYLDSAATTLRPDSVIDAISRFYRTGNANPGAVLHTLARRASQTYEGARRTAKRHASADRTTL